MIGVILYYSLLLMANGRQIFADKLFAMSLNHKEGVTISKETY